MSTVVLEVRSLADTLADASRAMKSGKGDTETRIGSFMLQAAKNAP